MRIKKSENKKTVFYTKYKLFKYLVIFFKLYSALVTF